MGVKNQESDQKCTESSCSSLFNSAHDAVEATGELVILTCNNYSLGKDYDHIKRK